ncbi:alpha/beta hydrolase [Mesorhizobium sp. M6A.T.Cr.TU.017.01.1.1]|uniref:alpha/beta hydrolase n=1 Tax=Mesorhizobium sp. M6A.T.Cr.TU.017.01.1.1 TaxID=2496774 RepID=UPI000FD2B535|nr:alpha/beta hydrolase [Mesorhizobium sp. M6A.T.Cr.TU.017.01.1.1]RUV04146.1 alpha/beta hydrolase [Mesorhizobium sp. M6A.T.Cr.TU.017.01.1.1]
MAKAEHVEWVKDGHSAWNDRRRLVKFSPDLSGLNFREAIPEWYSGGTRSDFFRRFNFSDANLREANFAGFDFSRSKFEGADLSGADLTEATFNSAKFNRADLSRVRAQGAHFVHANFAGARFENAQLEDANFAGAIIERLSIPQAQRQSVLASVDKIDDFVLDGWAGKTYSRPRLEMQNPAESKEPTYQVLYATNRNLLRTGTNISFGSERNTALSYGSCEVFVPKSHKVGSIGSPFWKRLLKGDDRLKIRNLVLLDDELHWQVVRDNFSTSKGASPPTILIHGYNNKFETAVLWAAQIGLDLGLERGVSLFSWPSKGTLKGYAADEAAVEASKYVLVEYLLRYLKNARGVGVNVIAHSMGCRCLVGALEIIGFQQPDKLNGINQIIVAAADVDQDVMTNVGPHIILNSGRTTSYVCGGDVALSASGWLHDYARVGLLPPIFLFDKIDTVEVEKTDLLGWGHGYVAEAKPILNDIFQIITHSAAPEKRFSLKPASASSSAHWKLID